MYGWSFPARTITQLSRVLRALGKHRYLQEVDHRVHWTVDRALAKYDQRHRAHAERFKVVQNEQPALDLGSRDPKLWRSADVDEVLQIFELLWADSARAGEARASLLETLRAQDFPAPQHQPFDADVDEPPHPELLMLDWVMLPVDQLDSERHRGALAAMADTGDEVDASAPIYVEGPALGEPELCQGLTEGEIACDFMSWADGPYSYCDYVFRGIARAAKLSEPPLGYRDVDTP